MEKKLWLVAAMVLGAVPVWAQPNNVGAMAPSDEIGVADLERAIGGRTTLELKFKDLTTEQVTEIIGKESGLRLVAPVVAASTSGRVTISSSTMSSLVVADHPTGLSPIATWNGDVDKTDFWLALRLWGRAENVRLQRERDAVQKRQNEEKSPDYPRPAAGETEIAPEVMAEWRAKQTEWSQRRMAELGRFGPNRTLSASFDANAAAWKLSPGSQLISGRAVNSWPCLVLATGFQRQQNMTIQEAEPPGKDTEATTENKATTAKTADKAVDKAPVVNERGEEMLAGGTLSDSLTLNLLVYAEPKLRERAKVIVQVDEARDDAGQDLMPSSQSSLRGGSYVVSTGFYGGQDGGISQQIQLRPRQATGQKLAILRGVVEIRYPLKLQEHEITNFDGTQDFLLNTDDLPAQAKLTPPRLENGQLRFSASLELKSSRGGRRMVDTRQIPAKIRGYEGMSDRQLLPDNYTFTDTQGRTWRGGNNIGSRRGSMGFRGPDGTPIPVTSPPTPPPDNFTYKENWDLSLHPVRTDLEYPNQRIELTSDELANVRFTKATFTTESDWRTLEVPFEFRDLPLPPR